jgi:ABA/WDS induced protein
MYTALQ